MKVTYMEFIDVVTCRNNPECLVVFGDNIVRRGRKGQAVIRNEPNAFGLLTKRYPSVAEHAYFDDFVDSDFEALDNSLRDLWRASRGKDIIFPWYGVGTGLSQMPKRCPILYQYMCDTLRRHFGIINDRSNNE